MAPIADSLNHNPSVSTRIDLVNKKLHGAKEIQYDQEYNFETRSYSG